MPDSHAIRTAPPADSPPRHRAAVRWVLLIYFCSGACSLIDEVVWVRLLKLTLGNTVYASSIVVSTFMGGLALGALIMARYADRVRRRLRLYALLELLIAAAALALPWALRGADAAYRWFFVTAEPSPAALRLVQVLLSGALLLVPTVLMGSTLPLLGRFVTSLEQRIGRRVGRLYALNTLGAAAGCFLAGFVLIRVTGVMGTLYLAAGLNVLVALGAWGLSRLEGRPARVEAPPAPGAHPTDRRARGRGQRAVLLTAFFLSGLASIGYELIWMRTAGFLLGSYTYVFSGVLTVYLVGNVAGAWIGSALSRRLARPAVGFAVSLTVLGGLGVAYLPLFNAWFGSAEGLLAGLFAPGALLYGVQKAVAPMIHSAVLFFVPAVAMGVGFPLALQAWGRVRHDVGRTTGNVYAVNTIGAVLGGIVTGFALIPLAGVQASITVLGLAAVWTGCALGLLFLGRRGKVGRVVLLAAGVGLTALAVLVPGGLFERNVHTGPAGEIVAVREGVVTTVAVTRKPDGHLLMSIDNVAMAGDDIHRSAQQTLGHLGPLLHPGARTVLSVGFGCGETTACLSRHGPERIDCVEIAPEVIEVAREHFGHVNLGKDLERHVRMLVMDAKNFLALTDRRYDLIVNDSDVHATAGSAPLYSAEHFQAALDHLTPGGLFLAKLHLQGHPRSNFDCVLATFVEVFPHVTLWFPTTRPFVFFYLVCSREPITMDLGRIEAELRKPAVRQSVALLNLHDAAELATWYVGDKDDIRRCLGETRVHSDYRPFLDYNLDPTRLVRREYFVDLVESLRQGSIGRHVVFDGLTAAQREAWKSAYVRQATAAAHVFRAHGAQEFVQQLVNSYRGLLAAPAHGGLLEIQEQCLDRVRRELLARRLDPAPVQGVMDRLIAKDPRMGPAWLVKSYAAQAGGDRGAALAAAQNAADASPRFGEARRQLGRLLESSGDLAAAAAQYELARQIRPQDAKVAARLAWCLAVAPEPARRDGPRAVALAEEACRLTRRRDPEALDALAAAYAETGRFDRAASAARDALARLGRDRKALADAIRRRLALYRAKKPYHLGR